MFLTVWARKKKTFLNKVQIPTDENVTRNTIQTPGVINIFQAIS